METQDGGVQIFFESELDKNDLLVYKPVILHKGLIIQTLESICFGEGELRDFYVGKGYKYLYGKGPMLLLQAA